MPDLPVPVVDLVVAFQALLLVGAASLLALSAMVYLSGCARIVPAHEVAPAEAALVLGAFVDGERVSDMLADRLDTAYDLYAAGKVARLLLSGDHGRPDYDEVTAMRKYMLRKGAAPEHLFLDHAGFNTYNSLLRARDVFQVQRVIVVTQRFHLPRALWTARCLGLSAQGVLADRHGYVDAAKLEVREAAARVKAFCDVVLHRKPAVAGPALPITGDGRQSWGA